MSSPKLDLENADLYAEAGVKEYWIVFGHERQVEVYRLPENGHYHQRQVFGAGEVVNCASLPSVCLRVADLFV